MKEEVDLAKAARIVKRIKGVILIREIVKDCDINAWINPFPRLLHDVIAHHTLNEFNVYDLALKEAVLQTLKDDKEISEEDYFYLSEYIEDYSSYVGSNNND